MKDGQQEQYFPDTNATITAADDDYRQHIHLLFITFEDDDGMEKCCNSDGMKKC